MFRSLIIVLLSLLLGGIALAEPFKEAYAEVVWSDLIGLSSTQNALLGLREGDSDYFLTVRNTWYDTTGTDLPFQESVQGTTAGIGARRWLLDRKVYALAIIGTGVLGENKGRSDIRAGVAGSNYWEQGKHYYDLYGELFWIERGDDVYLNIRYRDGKTLKKTVDSRLWVYVVGTTWASGKGENGTENRVEAGVGVGYLFREGSMTANVELRAGHSFSGTISDRNYINPAIVLAGNF